MSIIVLRKYGNAHTGQKTEEKPRFLGALRRGSEGRSIVLLVDIDARNVFEAVPEFSIVSISAQERLNVKMFDQRQVDSSVK